MRTLDGRVSVAGQIRPDQLPALAAAGVRAVINNRPDGEEPGQPSAAEMREAAERAGPAPEPVGLAPEEAAPDPAEEGVPLATSAEAAGAGLSADEVGRLRDALADLAECRRVLASLRAEDEDAE